VLAIVTSKVHHSADAILASAGIRDYFKVVVGADDVAHPKPHRDSVDVALRGLGHTDIGRYGAVIGDTDSDIGLGKAVGAFTIGVTYGVFTIARILASQPDALAHTFDEATNAVLTRIEGETSL
jgi:phosphoglycolate phosphatase